MDSQAKDLLYISAQDESKYVQRMVRKVHRKNTKISAAIESHLQELFYHHSCKFNCSVPKRIFSLDEKYLSRCMEMIHISATRSGICKISMESGSLMGVLPLAVNDDAFGSARFLVECSSPAVSEKVNFSLPGQWIVGSITESRSMKNILKSSLYQRLGVYNDDKDNLDSEYHHHNSIRYTSQKLKTDKLVPGHNANPLVIHSRFSSISRTNALAEKMSFTGAAVSHGVLQSSLIDEEPHYVFSVDEKREVYEAKLLKTELSSGEDGMEWIYLFYLRNQSHKVGEAYTNEQYQIGKMKASARFTVCQNNFKIMEMEFVMYGHDETYVDDFRELSHSLRKSSLSKKLVSTFKPSSSIRKRTKSAFWGTTSSVDYCPWEAPKNTQMLHAALDMTRPSQKIQNCEIAAIVTKRCISIQYPELTEIGGWGMNILKKVSPEKPTGSQEPMLLSSTSHQCCTNECCASMDIIIPAGYHGRPETGNGCPTSLVERWKTEGMCDCGGWDLGCPVTVLNIRSSEGEFVARTTSKKENDVVLKGTETHPPKLKMVAIGTGLYYLDFQPSLSALQCFSMAVAILHERMNAWQSKEPNV